MFKGLVIIYLIMCMLFLYVIEFFVESSEGSYFLFEVDVAGFGFLKGMDWESCR